MICSTAVAVVLHLASVHSAPGFNNANYGLGAQCRISEHVSVEAGVYRNSYDRTSPYVVGELRTATWHGWSAGVAVGSAANYPRGVIPVGGLTLHSPAISGWSLSAIAGPKVYEGGAAVLHFMLVKSL